MCWRAATDLFHIPFWHLNPNTQRVISATKSLSLKTLKSKLSFCKIMKQHETSYVLSVKPTFAGLDWGLSSPHLCWFPPPGTPDYTPQNDPQTRISVVLTPLHFTSLCLNKAKTRVTNLLMSKEEITRAPLWIYHVCHTGPNSADNDNLTL